jgi:signal transduction histidine kinase
MCFFITSHAQDTSHEVLKTKVKTLLENNEREEALKLTLKALKAAEKNNNNTAQMQWNNQAGKILRDNHNFKNSLEYFNSAKILSEKTKDSFNIVNSIFNIATLNNYEYSIASYNGGDIEVKKEKRTLAIEQFEYLLLHFKNTKGIEKIFAKTHANLTGLYAYIEKNDKADASANKAIELFKKLNDTISVLGVQSNLGVSHIYRKEYDKAEKNFLEAQPFLKDTSNIKILDFKIINLNNLSQIYQLKGSHLKALEYLDQTLIYKNIIDNKKHNLALSEIEEKYSQEKAVLIAEEKAEVMQLWLGIIIILSAAAIIFGFITVKNNKLKSRNLNLKMIKSDLEKSNEIKKIKNENQLNLISAALDARIKERKYIAEVLHDSVSSLLSSANMHLQVVKRKSEQEIEELDKTSDIIKEAANKIRTLSHKLTSTVLLKFGVSIATQDLCDKYSNSELSFDLQEENKIPRFEETLEIKFYNIIEEITNNIIKHSQATNALITLNYINKKMNITIADNGIGFDVATAEKKGGIGLNLIKSRVMVLNGNMQITSSKEKGTKIHLVVPAN